MSPLTACLAFVLRQAEIDAAIVGVNSLAEFDEIAAAVAKIGKAEVDHDGWRRVEPIYLDPSRWPTSVH